MITGSFHCAQREGYEFTNFIMDGFYGTFITAIPIAIITTLNILIVRQLFLTRNRRALFSTESKMRIESTVIILIVSTASVLLNFPYFIVWCMNFGRQFGDFLHPGNLTGGERLRGWVFITKTIFYFNYSFNFFLYSLSGGVFRKHLYQLCCKRQPRPRDTYQFAALNDGASRDLHTSGYVTSSTNV